MEIETIIGVCSTSTGVTAKEGGRSFDIVTLDLTVKGGMGGEETFRQLREIDPTVRAVVFSAAMQPVLQWPITTTAALRCSSTSLTKSNS